MRKTNNYKVLWLSGRPCSGKTTLGDNLERELRSYRKETFRIDGDLLRNGLNKDLGFSPGARKENLRRASEITKLFKDYYIYVIASFITPTIQDMDYIHSIIGIDFKNIYVKCSLDKCIDRDVKGMYKKAMDGKILNFTGVDAPYEEPQNPWLVINTEELTIKDSVNIILDKLLN